MARNRWSFVSAAVLSDGRGACTRRVAGPSQDREDPHAVGDPDLGRRSHDAERVRRGRGGTDQQHGDVRDTARGRRGGVNDTLDAVDKGLIEARLRVDALLVGQAPGGGAVRLAGRRLRRRAWTTSRGSRGFCTAAAQQLYDQLWKEMKVNVKGFILQPVGPEALGWFKKPINSMADFRKLRFRTPPGIPGQIYNDIGVASVAMGGGDILPGLEKGVIDAAEWCCPKPDMTFGFHKVLKHYYLEGLHQVVVNADLYINGDVWRSLSPLQQKAIEVSANASLMKTVAYRIHENGKALKELTEKHGVILHDTPNEYFNEYGAAAMKNFEKNAAANPFFKKVWDSQKSLGRHCDPVLGARAEGQRAMGGAYAAELAKKKPAAAASGGTSAPAKK